MTTYPEDRVLKSLDPVPEDEDEWPDFALRDVKIFYQGKGRYADLLEASPEVPLCVLGELMPLEDHQENLALLENPTYTRIKIDNVTNYSIGQDDNSKIPQIWAAGKAGWYEINPSDRYLSHYSDTIEAIDMFYFMVDQYQRLSPKRRRLGFRIDPFLTAYQKHTDYRVDDDDEAMEILHKHHKFLLKQMFEEREDIDWSQTHLWNHLAETYVEEIEELRKGAATTQGPAPDPDTDMEEITSPSDDGDGSKPSATSSAVQSEVKSPMLAQSSASSNSTQDNTEEETAEDDNDQTDYTKLIWTLLNVLRKTATYDIKHAGIDPLAKELIKLPEFPGSKKAALNAIERVAEPLLRLMHEAKLRKKFNWSTRAIYAELEATLADGVAQEIKTPAPRVSKKKHRLKSVLRPSGASKASKRTSSTALNQDDDDDDLMHDISHTAPSARRVKMNGHRGGSVESGGSRMDSPSRQLNGHFDIDALPELPPVPEAQDMLELVRNEAKKHGRAHQVSHLEALLGHFNGDFG